MIVNRSQSRWIGVTGAIAAGATIIYLIYAATAANGPRAGSLAGLIFAFAGTGIIFFECLLSLRKKYPASPIGRVKTWLRAHVWLGLLSFILILFHSGLRWGEGLAAAIMWMFLIITVSGIYGVILQNYLPRRMTELITKETIYEEIPNLVYQIRMEADERVEFITADLQLPPEEREFQRAGGVKQYFDPGQKKSAAEKVAAVVERRKATAQIQLDDTSTQAMRDHYLQEIRPFLVDAPTPGQRDLFGTRALVGAYFNHLRTIMPVAAHDVLTDLEEVCEERRQLALQQRLHRWLHGWLYVHVPISFAFLVLVIVHAVISLRY